MSSDLWAAFGGDDTAQNPWTSTQSDQPVDSSQPGKSVPKELSHSETLDPWASFESPETQVTSAAIAAPAVQDQWAAFESAAPSANNAIEDDWSAFESSATQPKGSTGTFNDDGLMWDADTALQDQPTVSHPVQVAAPTLIDISRLAIADQHDDDDEFGDFEQAEIVTPLGMPPTPPAPAKVDAPTTIMQTRIETQGVNTADRRVFGATKKGNATLNRSNPGQAPVATLIDTDNDGAAWNDIGWASHPSNRAGNASTIKPTALTATRTTSRVKPKVVPASKTTTTLVDNDDDDEAWDDFTSLPPETKSSSLTPAITSEPLSRNSKMTVVPTSKPSAVTPSKPALPPTNIPPPSILISYIHLTELPSLTSPSSTRSPVASLRAAAHILAGRKLRWKRDTHLAQSMSISASGPGLKSGMKLTGVDKSESIREDREAAELVRVFKQSAGALRGKAMKAGEKGIVDLGETLMVRSEKAGTGIVGGLKPCVICGLRRAERVGRVDADIYDGFGEWWVEHWGHKECKEWWEENEANMGKR